VTETSQTGAAPPPPDRTGGRYQRSVSGLIGALIVTLLVIAAFVAFRALNRDELETSPGPVDYREQAELAQEAGLEVAYPSELPSGWRATNVEVAAGERPVWAVGILTDEQRYVGIRQEDDQLDDLLATYVDEDVEARAPIRVEGSVAREWQVFEDEGGDLAYAAELDDEVLLVYGSAGEEDLRLVLERLTTEPVSSS
jgi:hypothetical protein